MKIKHLLATSFLMATIGTSVFADSPVQTNDFTDISGHWGENYIQSAVDKGFFNGKSAGIFAPNDQITRAEFIVVINQMVGAGMAEVAEDAPWYEAHFLAAKNWFLIPESFTLENVTEPITREEMACMLIMAVGEYYFAPVEGNAQNLSDYEEISSEYASYVTQAVESGLMSGMGEGEFAPLNNATRAEAATVVVGVADKYFPEIVEFDNALSAAFTEVLQQSRSAEEAEYIPAFGSMTNPTWMAVEGLFGFDNSQVSGFSMAVSQMMVQAYCVAIVQPVEGQEDAVLAGFDSFKSAKMNDFNNYLMDQYEIAENPVVLTMEDGTLVFVMSEHAEEIAANIQENLENLGDLSGVGDMGVLPI